MSNANVFTGADGSISLSARTDIPEGQAAQKIVDAYKMIPVGRVQDVRVEVNSAVKAFHEIGQRYPTELRPGNVTIKGTIARAYINGALLKLLLGEAADNRPAGSWMQPEFNITLVLSNPAISGVSATLVLHDVKLDGWVGHVPEDDFVLESATFQALYMTTADQG